MEHLIEEEMNIIMSRIIPTIHEMVRDGVKERGAAE